MKSKLLHFKYKFKAAFFLAIALTSCTTYGVQKTIRGNGNVIVEERPSSSFSSIKAAEGVEVILSFGDEENIRVEADKNVIDFIKTEIRDNHLNIHIDNEVRLKDCIKKVYVTYQNLNKLKVTSGAVLKEEELLKANNLSLSASSGGVMKLEVSASFLKASVSSGGIMKIRGQVNTLQTDASSGGILKAPALNGKNIDAKTSSGGILRVGEFSNLKANASSGGVLKYSGNPSQKDISKSSGGIVSCY
jgi:DUF4097 and DUF4098 domain-containing protein YvlB